jgi:hypothetical protein
MVIGATDYRRAPVVAPGMPRISQVWRSPVVLRVRLDLSELDFIDCCGINGILRALAEARRLQWDLEVDPLVSPGVRRITSLEDIASELWPACGALR